jgi:glyoxylase-like metal-dependent hydrolase (beta-lactamase superfamily II)
MQHGQRIDASSGRGLQLPAEHGQAAEPAAGVPVKGDSMLEQGLGVRWIHGAPDCALETGPALQVHAFDKDTYILRQSKCTNFEAPFLYLLFGAERALLVDTGASSRHGQLPVRATVQGIIDQWQAIHDRPSLELIVAHSHGHGDHAAGDEQFLSQPATTLVPPGLEEVQRFFGFERWPEQTVSFDLGKRKLTILPLPGHLDDHIGIYDPKTRILLSGDTFYPGFLYVSDRRAYRRSIARLAGFAARHPIRYFLGAHIEMTSTKGLAYRSGTLYQPVEHVLELFPWHLAELHAAIEDMGDDFSRRVFDDFILQP